MPDNANAFAAFQQAFRAGGDFIRDGAGQSRFTYDDLERRSSAWAAGFRKLGVQIGDRVIVQVEKSPENLFVYFACLRAGFVYLPLNTAYLEHEVRFFCEDAEPGLVICDPANASLFEAVAGCPVLTLDANGEGSAVAAANGEFPVETRAADDTAVILYTSGTTGRPKGAMITHANLIANARTLAAAWQWQENDVLLHALPVFHIHGLFVATHLAVLGGSPMIFLPRFEPEAVIAALPKSTVYMGVPTNYTRLLANPALTADTCANMRLFTSGSAPLLVQTFEEFQARTGHTIVERYGMTETGMNTSNPLDGERKPGTVGPPLPDVEIRVDAPRGEPGPLLVRGPNVFKGYWRMPEKTADEFDSDGFFRTGDLATEDEDGYVAIVGRSKDMIITGGLNVYPKEIEAIIDDFEEVIESAVIGVPDPDFGEAVTAVIVRRPDAELTEADVIGRLKATLANFKVAKRVHFVDALPRNTMGKVQKAKLREDFGPA